MTSGVFVGGPIAGQVVFVPGNGKSPEYRNGKGARIAKGTSSSWYARHYLLRHGDYVWSPAQRKIVTPIVDMLCPQCGGPARKLAGAVDFVCSRTCGWWNLTCRGCGLAPREGRHGIALCGACRTGEFAHLDKEPS